RARGAQPRFPQGSRHHRGRTGGGGRGAEAVRNDRKVAAGAGVIAYALAFLLVAGGAQPQQEPPATKQSKKAKGKSENREKKPKKEKKPKVAKPAPDEIVDVASDGESDGQDIEHPGTFGWRTHPTLEFGPVRLAGEFKFQEDGHTSYDGAQTTAGMKPWELHRNRVGIKGKVGK